MQPIILPPPVRTQVLYQVPRYLVPSYRRNLEPQIFGAQTEFFDSETEAFGIPEEVRHQPERILELIGPVQDLAQFSMTTSDPMLSALMFRPAMRSAAIIALGVMANIHIEGAGAIREQGQGQDLINRQLERAHHLMGLQIQHLTLALDAGEDVAAVIQTIIENRDALGYEPPLQLRGRARRFWDGLRPPWPRSP